MTFKFIRFLFLVLSGLVGYYLGNMIQFPFWGVVIGLVSGLVLIVIEQSLRGVSVRGLSSTVFGLILGLIMAKLVIRILWFFPLSDFYRSVFELVLNVVFGYLGAMMALRGRDEFNVIIPYVRFKRQDVFSNIILLDTSAIIDGRISDIYKSKFLMGRLVAPLFVVEELQVLADAPDEVKRQKGRRGLEILKNLQHDPEIDIRIHEEEFPKELAVDAKLTKLAKFMDASLCTVDFNLEKTASLQGINVLNLNALANALKSVIFPGELLDLHVVKEGKEGRQGIGYLDDGTMVIVNEGRPYIGQYIPVMVTSILQTQTGKMIFADVKIKG